MRYLLALIIKPFKDFALIFYDDLEFRAMSLPRVAAGALTAAVGISWIGAQFYGKSFSGFEALCGLCGGVWAAYTFKRRLMPPNNEVIPDERGNVPDGENTEDENTTKESG